MKNYSFILGGILVFFIMIGAGCSVRDAQPSPDSSNEDGGIVEAVTSSTKFPGTNLEYYLQSYREHALSSQQKLDKKILKPALVISGIDQTDKKPVTVTMYSDAKWNDGKEHVFDIEEAKGSSVRQFGQFSSVMKNFVTESGKITNGKVIGDFLEIRGIKIVSK